MKRQRLSLVLASAALVAAATTARAQPAAAPPGSGMVVPELAAEEMPVPRTDITGKAGTLSDKLSISNGVIHPEGNVDPGLRKPAPATGTMPVIPPPGSPGGATTVQPK